MDFRYLTESKNEFMNLLNSILIPHLYNGINDMLGYSIQTNNMLEEKHKKNKNIPNPGILNIFKMSLNEVSSINNYEIETEYKRIKENCGCSDWFDNLIKASFKSYVLFLTWDPQESNSKYSENDLYDNISPKDFIHKCYIETCNYFFNDPELFLRKNSKREIYEIIKNCIELSIKKTLPYNEIIQEYLKINFSVKNENHLQNTKEIANIKSMVFRILSQNKYGGRPTGKVLISENSTEKYNNYEGNGVGEMEQFIKEAQLEKTEPVENNIPNELLERENIIEKEHFIQEGNENAIFKPINKSLKSMSLSETSDDFQLPEKMKKSLSSIKNDREIGYNEIEDTELSQKGGKIETSTNILTRSENKRRELEIVLNNNQHSETSKTSKTSKTHKTASNLISPLPIKKNHIEQIYDDFGKTPQIGGNIRKRKVQIIKNKSNTIHDKVNGYNNYFTNLIK